MKENQGSAPASIVLPGAPAPGYYFSATDREPKPGEYKYLTQGMLLVGDVVVSLVSRRRCNV